MRSRRSILFFVTLLAIGGASAMECEAPPVTNAAQAVCATRAFVENGRARLWKTGYFAQETPMFWYVRFEPRTPQTRGGAGLLKVDKASAHLVALRLER